MEERELPSYQSEMTPSHSEVAQSSGGGGGGGGGGSMVPLLGAYHTTQLCMHCRCVSARPNVPPSSAHVASLNGLESFICRLFLRNAHPFVPGKWDVSTF